MASANRIQLRFSYQDATCALTGTLPDDPKIQVDDPPNGHGKDAGAFLDR